MILKCSLWRNLDVIGIVGVSASAEKLSLSIGRILFGVSTWTKYAGESSEVGPQSPGATLYNFYIDRSRQVI